ncbi:MULTISPECIES: hypothetical protein [Bacteroidales]|jgi:hypothetical protein|nr:MULTISPECIES: hypothetical protein [Bacteroidales]
MNLRVSSPKDMTVTETAQKKRSRNLDRSTHAYFLMGFTRALLDFPNIAN